MRVLLATLGPVMVAHSDHTWGSVSFEHGRMCYTYQLTLAVLKNRCNGYRNATFSPSIGAGPGADLTANQIIIDKIPVRSACEESYVQDSLGLCGGSKEYLPVQLSCAIPTVASSRCSRETR